DRAEPLDVFRPRVDDRLRELDLVDRRDERGQAAAVDRLDAVRKRMPGPADRVDVEDHGEESNGTRRASSSSAITGSSRRSMIVTGPSSCNASISYPRSERSHGQSFSGVT